MRFGSHTFVPISWMCKKQPAVSHSSTESEIISLDTGLRLDGLPALELWDLIVSILGNISRVSDRSGKSESDDHKHHESHNKIDVTKDIDVVPGLSSSSSGSSSTSRTPMRQESHSSSSSSSPSSPTVGEIPVREREDAPNSDISPVPVSELVDDSSGKPDEIQANKIPKNK